MFIKRSVLSPFSGFTQRMEYYGMFRSGGEKGEEDFFNGSE